MNLRDAQAILLPHIVGYKPGERVYPEQIRSAFAAAVKLCHPDHGLADWPFDKGPPHSVTDLKKARDVWLGSHPDQDARVNACGYCRGTGWQSVGMRKVRCVKGCEET